jgi:hypothetical protein
MANDITFVAAANSTPATGTIIETVETSSLRHAQLIVGGSKFQVTKEWEFSSAQTNTSLVTASSTQQIGVLRSSMTISNTAAGDPSVRLGFTSGAGLTAPSPSGVTGIISTHPGLPKGSGIVEGNGGSFIAVGAADNDIRFTCSDPQGGIIRVLLTYIVFNA